MRRNWFALVLIVAAGCRGAPASAEDCDRIYKRMMELELRELGFRDPALLKKRTAELSVKLRAQLDQCLRRPLPPGALACVAIASSIEELSHRCLNEKALAVTPTEDFRLLDEAR